jgi:hypothetical protein
MTKDEIIELAMKCGASKEKAKTNADIFEAFAKLVAQHEREACAKIVEVEAMQYAEPVWALEIVNDIRARGQA